MTIFEKMVEENKLFGEFLEEYARRIKHFLDDPEIAEITSNEFEIPQDNKKETYNMEHYFLRIMCRYTSNISDFSQGIIKVLGRYLTEEDFKKIVSKRWIFTASISNNGLMIKLCK